MAKKVLFIFYFLFFIFYFLQGQNLVQNYSFEDTISCPVNSDEMYRVQNWFKPTFASSDYYNGCSIAVGVPENFLGYQPARTGNAYVGIVVFIPGGGGNTNYREYVEGRLSDSLTGGKKYCVSFFVSLIRFANYAINSIGAYFLKDSLFQTTGPDLLAFNPQIQNTQNKVLSDTINWIEVRDTFMADGGEKYLIIGNFYPDSLTDTLLNYPSGGSSYYYIDDVSVYLCDSGNSTPNFHLEQIGYKIFPNPSSKYLELVFNKPISEKHFLEIYDVFGKRTSVFEIPEGADRKRISLESFESGVYFCRVAVGGFAGETKKIVVMK